METNDFFSIIINVLVSFSDSIEQTYYGSTTIIILFNSFSAGTAFRRQILTYEDGPWYNLLSATLVHHSMSRNASHLITCRLQCYHGYTWHPTQSRRRDGSQSPLNPSCPGGLSTPGADARTNKDFLYVSYLCHFRFWYLLQQYIFCKMKLMFAFL